MLEFANVADTNGREEDYDVWLVDYQQTGELHTHSKLHLYGRVSIFCADFILFATTKMLVGTAHACIVDGILRPIRSLDSLEPQPPSVALKRPRAPWYAVELKSLWSISVRTTKNTTTWHYDADSSALAFSFATPCGANNAG